MFFSYGAFSSAPAPAPARYSLIFRTIFWTLASQLGRAHEGEQTVKFLGESPESMYITYIMHLRNNFNFFGGFLSMVWT